MLMRAPYVVEGNGREEKTYDLYARLLKDRIIFIGEEFSDDLANAVVAQLLFLESQNSESDIYMYINSPGGSINGMFAIIDTMNYIKPDIVTVGFGLVASAACFTLAAGTKGKRYALPNTEIMAHQPSSGTKGVVTDMKIDLEHVLRLKEKLNKYFASFTGQKIEKVENDLERDLWLTADEAKEYGIIDSVQYSRV